jgi:polysaccharide deacetylase 2 family uncharacterized protein YibQ
VIKCVSQIDSAYQYKAHLNKVIDINSGQRHYFLYSSTNKSVLIVNVREFEKIAKKRGRQTRN